MNGWVKKWTEKVYIKKDIKYLQFAFQNSLNEDNDVFTPMKKVLGVKTKKKKTFSSPQGPGSPPPPQRHCKYYQVRKCITIETWTKI